MTRLLILLALLAISTGVNAARSLTPQVLRQIEPIVQREIDAGHLPGAVILIGGENAILYRRAFGDRAVQPEHEAMTEDTIFDLASLTKAIATTTAVMQLVEIGKLDLDARVSRYWPRFAVNGKGGITVRQLLTHYSGLPADLDLKHSWSGRKAARRFILEERLVSLPGTRYLYSDVNFEVLGELVERISGMPLDAYCKRHVFDPLGMYDTSFKPQDIQRVAPTEWGRRGVVHDPTAYRMGGVSGHAGLFSTVDDLARFAQMMLKGGSIGNVRVLKQSSIELMTAPQSPSGQPRLRGLGWDISAPFASSSETLPQVGAYGHTGFTGTSLWIDPVSKFFMIVLSNRVHPNGRGDVKPLRNQLSVLMGNAMGSVSDADIVAERPGLARYVATAPVVMSGLDVLAAQGFSPLKGMRVGLITNQTGRDMHGQRNVELLSTAPGVKLVALFSPEHGLYGNLDEKVASGSEPTTGLPVYSLYGEVRRPTSSMLKDVDALVFDIQDAGARFYTYTTTMAYAMESAAAHGIPIYILDRPDPINAATVQGPLLDAGLKSFTGYYPLPVRYGMTLGELAGFLNDEAGIGANLHVIAMRGYQRADWYDGTGLSWIAPSPNLHNLTEATLYPGIAMVEGSNVSVGRGTETPFEVIGAPWIDAAALARYLEARSLPGIRFTPTQFTPNADRFKGQRCYGIHITVSDRDALNSPVLGVEIAAALYHLYRNIFLLDNTLGAIGSQRVLEAIRNEEDPRSIAATWQKDLQTFQNRRAHYLIYQ